MKDEINKETKCAVCVCVCVCVGGGGGGGGGRARHTVFFIPSNVTLPIKSHSLIGQHA